MFKKKKLLSFVNDVILLLTYQISTKVCGHDQVEHHETQEEKVDHVQLLIQAQCIITEEGTEIAVGCHTPNEAYKRSSERQTPHELYQ